MNLLTQPELNSIRDCDLKDAREAKGVHFDRLDRLVQESRKAMTGARNTTRPGCPPGLGGLVQAPGGGLAQGPRSGEVCEVPACADVLGFNTLNVGTFPFAGGGLGVVTNVTVITVESGNATAFQPTKFFFEGRDFAAGLGNVPCLLADVSIAGVDQLVDNSATSGITSAVFALTNEPLPVGWDPFALTGAQRLFLTFANILAVAVTLELFGVIWGSRLVPAV